MDGEKRRLLHGLKVLDGLEHMAGPFGTMILADMGAEGVWKLERPGTGDLIRAWGDGSETQRLLPPHPPRTRKASPSTTKRPRKAAFKA